MNDKEQAGFRIPPEVYSFSADQTICFDTNRAAIEATRLLGPRQTEWDLSITGAWGTLRLDLRPTAHDGAEAGIAATLRFLADEIERGALRR